MLNNMSSEGPSSQSAALHGLMGRCFLLFALPGCVNRPLCRFCRACVRLLQRADVLMPLMEGLEICISEASVVAPDGAHINIAWDSDI